MSKLYVGNLPSDVTESSLRQLFADHNISCGAILVKRGGYAFVDCPDQNSADRAIDKLNGKFIFKNLISAGNRLFKVHFQVWSQKPKLRGAWSFQNGRRQGRLRDASVGLLIVDLLEENAYI